MAFGRFGAVVGGDNMGLDGQLQFGDGKASLDQFRWVFGASEGVVSGSVSQEGESYMGRLSLAIDRLDVPDLTERIAHWVPAEAPATTNAADQAERADRSVVETLLRSELDIDAYADECRATLPGNQSSASR